MKNDFQNPITTPDWRAERLAAIKHLYPDLFTDEGKINPIEIGALVADGNISLGEKFEFRWPGKMQAKKNAFTSSKARLVPDMDRSVNFDETRNVIIEGENLEVLKLLSKAYYNKVKCIYIDPPYNTGHDFVYSDDYSEGKQAYWEKNGVFHDGLKVDTNSESAGRYHTNWLNMMMPRLLLAQMMLKDDGVIFVSIDDNEVHNLRKLMDEIFGQENFVVQISWKRKKETANDSDNFSIKVEYVLLYRKSEAANIKLLPLSEEYLSTSYHDPNEQYPDGRWRPVPIATTKGHKSGGYSYPVTTPSGKIIDKQWAYPEDSFKNLLAEGRIYFGKDGSGIPQRVVYEHEMKGTPPSNLWDDVGTNKDGKKEVLSLFDDVAVFDTVKPTSLIQRMLDLSSSDSSDDLIVDFFAGSGTSAQAVMQQNKKDGGNRKFVLVQIPEATEEKSEAFKIGYKKISDITIERVKRAGERIQVEKPEVDTGFKVFKLATSIFPENTYQSDPEKSADENVKALREHYARARQQLLFDPKGKETDLMYETLIKQGFMLTMTKERLKEFGENEVWKVTDGDRSVIVCLDAELKDATVKALAAYKDSRFIGLHRAVDTTKKWELTQVFGEALVLI